MKVLYYIIFLAVSLGRVNAVISYNPADWPAYTIKFNAQGTLKDVYDSGLRPWLAEGFETNFMGFKHARVTVETHEGIQLPEFPVEYADIYCTRDGLLKHIAMHSPSQPFENARALVSPWFPRIGKSESQLNEFFKIVKQNQIGYEDPDFGKAPEGFKGVWLDTGKTAYSIGLMNNKNPNLPFRIYFSVGWNKVLSERDRNMVHLEPIKPPPGYENESLKPPKHWGPDSTLEKMRALDLDTGESPEAVAEQRLNGDRPPLKGTAVALPSPPDTTKPNLPAPVSKRIPSAEPPRNLVIWPWLVGLFSIALLARSLYKRGV
jgi:hypothetical protein